MAGFERYIAKRMLKNAEGTRFSKPITRIAIASVALGVCVMILSVSIVRGFQYEIRDKVIGFGSHIQINHRTTNNSFESVPVEIDPAFMKELSSFDGVKHVQPYAIKPAILQVRRKTADTSRVNDNEILGVICKGVTNDFDWTFFKTHIKSGDVPSVYQKNKRNEILLSQGIATKLKVSVNDSLYLFMVVADGPKPQKFFVKGIYETGMADFDNQFVFIDIYHIQKINDWGVEGFVSIGERRENDFTLHTLVTGSAEHRMYQWNKSIPGYTDSLILPLKDTSIQLLVADYTHDADGRDWILKYKPDTVWIDIDYTENTLFVNTKEETPDFPVVSAPADSKTIYDYPNDQLILTQKNSGGSYRYTAGGYEILLNTWEDLLRSDEIIMNDISYEFETKPITELYPEIFDWLALLDTNVQVIIILMLLVCLINMASTLLVIILERTSMIGTLKAIGSSNKSIGKIFVMNAAWYITLGLFIGNVMAIGLGILQQQTGFIKMDQETYFMATVPVYLDVWYILAINLGTFLICTIAMFLPSMIIGKISPVKAIRFR